MAISGGNSLDYNYGTNIYYIFKKKFALGLGFRYGVVNWLYSKSDGFDSDDNWTEKTQGSSRELSAILGLSFKSFNIIYLYHYEASLTFDNFYMNDFETASFKGNGHMVKLLFNNSFSFFSLYAGINTYDKGRFDGSDISFPGSVSGIKFEELKTQYAGMELTIPIGIF